MNLSQLRYAKALAETGSFTQAAEQCYVTQPTLSNGIAQLDQELEERLFTRTTRAVSLTPFGRHVLPLIDKILNAQAGAVRGTVRRAGARNPAHPHARGLRRFQGRADAAGPACSRPCTCWS